MLIGVKSSQIKLLLFSALIEPKAIPYSHELVPLHLLEQ